MNNNNISSLLRCFYIRVLYGEKLYQLIIKQQIKLQIRWSLVLYMSKIEGGVSDRSENKFYDYLLCTFYFSFPFSHPLIEVRRNFMIA